MRRAIKDALNASTHRANLMCVDCHRPSVFEYVAYCDPKQSLLLSFLKCNLNISINDEEDFLDNSNEGLAHGTSCDEMLGEKLIVLFELSCLKDKKHKIGLCLEFSVQPGKGDNNACFVIRKVGQNPDMYVFQRDEIKEYRKSLEKFGVYNDYLCAIRCSINSLFSGAYAYLRRVFEGIISKRLAENGYDPNNREDMPVKIEKIKHFFDPDIQNDLYSYYQSLSKGIHQLSEVDCQKHFLILKSFIDTELVYINYQITKEKQLAKSRAAMAEIATNADENDNK